MDQERFDHLLRALATRPSRRIVLAGLTGGLFTALPLALRIDESAAKHKGKSRKHKKGSKHKGQTVSPPAPPSTPGPPPPPPTPVTHVDAECSALSDTTNGPDDGDSRLAQTFTALASGSLVSAELQIDKLAGSGGDFILRLSPVNAAGFPTNAVLASTSIPNLSVSAGPNDLSFTFPNPASVAAGSTYALVLTRPGSNSLSWLAHTGDTCSGGAFGSTSQTEEFMGPFVDFDFNFMTFVSS